MCSTTSCVKQVGSPRLSLRYDAARKVVQRQLASAFVSADRVSGRPDQPGEDVSQSAIAARMRNACQIKVVSCVKDIDQRQVQEQHQHPFRAQAVNSVASRTGTRSARRQIPNLIDIPTAALVRELYIRISGSTRQNCSLRQSLALPPPHRYLRSYWRLDSGCRASYPNGRKMSCESRSRTFHDLRADGRAFLSLRPLPLPR